MAGGKLPATKTRGDHRLFMTDRAFCQFGFVLLVTLLTEGVGRLFEGVDLFRHVSGLGVVTGLAFFDFLLLGIGEPFSFRAFAVVTGFTLQP